MVAFLLAMAVVGLADLRNGAREFPWIAAISLAALAVTKNEGTVMAVLLSVAALWRLPRRWRVPFLVLTLLPAVAWQGAVALAGIPRFPQILIPARILHRALLFSSAVAAAATPILVLELAVFVLVLVCPAPEIARFLRVPLALWLGIAIGEYLLSAPDLRWHVATSFQRVLAIPLPVLLALLLRWTFLPRRAPASELVP